MPSLEEKKIFSYSYNVPDCLLSRFIIQVESGDDMGGNELFFIKPMLEEYSVVIIQRRYSSPWVTHQLQVWLDETMQARKAAGMSMESTKASAIFQGEVFPDPITDSDPFCNFIYDFEKIDRGQTYRVEFYKIDP